MRCKKIANQNIKEYLQKLDVDRGGVSILAKKAQLHLVEITNLHVGAANILKQDALSVGADTAVPRGTIIAKEPYVNVLLIATARELEKLSKKLLVQPFGLQEVAVFLENLTKLHKPKTTQIMGVINANDDSFFSESRFRDKDAVLKIEQMIADGADIIDIGGVSSRPGSKSVSKEEELARVKPILDAIAHHKLYEKVTFSIDSYEPLVIAEALESGFSIINDITGLQNDEVAKLGGDYNATVVAMHMQGTPQTMQKAPHYDDVVLDIYDAFDQMIQKADSFGVKELVLDVGIGFGKTLEHNIALIQNLEHFLTLGKPLLVGASRKSMIDMITPSTPQQRLAGTLAIHLESVRNGASIVRVHDVYEHKQALVVQKLLKG